jgi:thiamine-phosphate pyrophosphorylase
MDKLNRILDANLNRAREGLRVVEELARLVLEHAKLQKQIKTVRHGITQAEKTLLIRNGRDRSLLESRAAYRDPGAKTTIAGEKKRTQLQDVARANIRRAQEALRVLEEISKLKNVNASRKFKALRFKSYDLEQDIVLALEKHQK